MATKKKVNQVIFCTGCNKRMEDPHPAQYKTVRGCGWHYGMADDEVHKVNRKPIHPVFGKIFNVKWHYCNKCL